MDPFIEWRLGPFQDIAQVLLQLSYFWNHLPCTFTSMNFKFKNSFPFQVVFRKTKKGTGNLIA